MKVGKLWWVTGCVAASVAGGLAGVAADSACVAVAVSLGLISLGFFMASAGVTE